MIDSSQVLTMEAFVGMSFYIPKAEGKRHPRRRCPIPWVSGEVRRAPFLMPRSRLDSQAKVDEGILGQSGLAILDIYEHIM
jgi:hypothetical protein